MVGLGKPVLDPVGFANIGAPLDLAVQTLDGVLLRPELKPALRQAVRLARNGNVIFYTFGPAEGPAFAGRGTGRDVKF